MEVKTNGLAPHLQAHLRWHKARIKFLDLLIISLIRNRSVNFCKNAVSLSNRVPGSNLRRIQRFFAGFTFGFDAIAPSVAMLNEVFFMLKGGISEEVATDKLRLSMLEIALTKYLKVLKGNFITSDSFEDEGPQPDLALLKKEGIPLRSFQKGNARYSIQETGHRRQMTSLLKNDGWTWMDVYHQGDD